MSYIVSFDDYNFPERGIHLETNFADAVPRTTRLPGLDGGYDEFGDDPAPSEIGRVNARLRLNAASGSAMQTTRDELRGLAAIGRGSLVMQPSGGTVFAQRWAWARINSVQVVEKMHAVTDRVQDISIDWQVSDSRWYSEPVATPGDVECAGTATDFQVSPGGNAAAAPVITVTAVGALPDGFTVQRLVEDVVYDEIEYGDALIDEDVVVMDCRALSVTKNDVAAYGTAFSTLHPAWMRLQPGDNDLRVVLNSGGSATLAIEWYDTWY